MDTPLTYLFVPGDRPERFAKAVASGAGAVIIDLEDAVAPDAKDRARVEVGDFVEAHAELAERLVVRINDAATAWFARDLELLQATKLRFAMLPKTESPEEIALVLRALPGGGGVLPLIETALGVRDVDRIAAAEGVLRLAFGTLDYAVDLGLSGDERGLDYAASRIAIASRCAGLPTPIAGVTPAINDEARLLDDLESARALGFGAKMCIHPRQVAAIHQAWQPTAAEVDWARRVLAAAAGAKGAIVVDGRMVDRPVLRKAQAIADRAKRGQA
ncbi:MAG: CoA ester lyase [Burkholderiales bacterium]|nr:CoA ester lyase [Burkholderiales bacterium]